MQLTSNAESAVAPVTTCCKPVASFSVFSTCLAYPSLSTPFYSRFSSSEEFLVVSMELYILAFKKD